LRGLAEEGQELAEREVHCLWSGEMRSLGDERDGSWGEAGAYCVCSVGVVEVYWDTDMYSIGCFAYLGGGGGFCIPRSCCKKGAYQKSHGRVIWLSSSRCLKRQL
jgi:hypothetical protein